MIKVEHLKKSFGKKEVLKDISANVDKGKVISIIGPSGSGKSTFFAVSMCLKRQLVARLFLMDKI